MTVITNSPPEGVEPRSAAMSTAIAAGRRAGEHLAEKPLTSAQRALLVGVFSGAQT